MGRIFPTSFLFMEDNMRQDFKSWPLNDVYHVQEALQEYDKDLYLLYNAKTNEHLIMDTITRTAVMKIPQPGFPELTSKVVDHMKKIHVMNGFDVGEEIKKSDDKREKERQRKLDDMAQDFAKESKEAYKNAFDYGRTDGAQKYVNGIGVST
jgi:flagellar biosynthesis/type III secretory pathway protein FliH